MPETMPETVTDTLLTAAPQLTADGALLILRAAKKKAEAMEVPQCLVVVDAGGNRLAYLRMEGAKVLSEASATNKAVTAASSRTRTGGVPAEVEMKLAVATQGQLVNLKGGLPVVVDGYVVGAVGVGSGTGEQDVEVGEAGLQAYYAALGRGGE